MGALHGANFARFGSLRSFGPTRTGTAQVAVPQCPPTGATGDFERLKDPAIESDLAALSSARDVTTQAAALAPIAKYVAANLPVIPTTTAADWFEYNSQNYVNWPTQAFEYDSGEPSGTNNGPGTGSDEVVLLHLTPAG